MLGALTLLALALAPDAHGLEASLSRAAEHRALEPLAGFRPLVHRLWLVEHHRGDWRPAFFLPPGEPLRHLPGRTVDRRPLPRLVLHGPTYRAPAEDPEPWRAWSTLPVDTSESLAHALVEASIYDHLAMADHRAAELRHRAEERMPEVPSAYRATAFASALADFGAHMLSIANETHRAAERARTRGLDPCLWLEREPPLFTLWRRSFEQGRYHGRYPLAAPTPQGVGTDPAAAGLPTLGSAGDHEPGWRTTRTRLELEDKRWLVETFLGGAWSGDPRQDFADLCRKAERDGNVVGSDMGGGSR